MIEEMTEEMAEEMIEEMTDEMAEEMTEEMTENQSVHAAPIVQEAITQDRHSKHGQSFDHL